MRKFLVFAIVAVALTIFNGCQKSDEQVLIGAQPQAVVKPDVYSKNGFLVFSNQQELSKTLNSLAQMTEKERKLWEGKHSFTSQMSMFHNIINAELKLDEPYENMSDEELKNAIPPAEHSAIYYKSLEKGIIKEYKDSDGSSMYDYSTCAPYLASVLNDEGIFMVGDTMYQYTPSAFKQWINCDINNKMKLVNTGESTDEISVNIQLKSTTVAYGSWEYDSGHKRRIRIGINFNSQQYYADGTVWKYTHWVEVQSQKKSWWGKWRYNWTDMYVKGHWDYAIDYGNPYYQEGEFNNSTGYHNYPSTHHVYASNYKSSCSISTGTIYPYGSVMYIMTDGNRDTGSFMQEDLKVIYDVRLTDFLWEVTGHAYVYANVSY